MSEVIVFDLGGVLCDFHPERRLAALAATTGLDALEIDRAIWISGLDERAERGELSRDEAIEAVLEALEYRVDDATLLHAWALAFEPNLAVLNLVSHVPARRFVFTNNGPILGDCLSPQITGVVDRVICSYELRARKPEPVAFRRLAVELGVLPSEIILVDDDEHNCDSARLIGMRAVQFLGAANLQSSLGAARG